MKRKTLMYTIRHKGKLITTSVGSNSYEDSVINLSNKKTSPGILPAGYEHRPDLIANLFFGSPQSWWVLCELNAVTDPFEGLNTGDELLLP